MDYRKKYMLKVFLSVCTRYAISEKRHLKDVLKEVGEYLITISNRMIE